jgi:hypothetical protein
LLLKIADERITMELTCMIVNETSAAILSIANSRNFLRQIDCSCEFIELIFDSKTYLSRKIVKQAEISVDGV